MPEDEQPDTEDAEEETTPVPQDLGPNPPPMLVNKHGDVGMVWKVLFLLVSLFLGPLSVGFWALMAWRGRTWNADHGRDWRRHVHATQEPPAPNAAPA